MNLNVSAIYVIRNIATGKVYVGSAVNVRKRWNEHKRTLRKNSHHNVHLQRAFNLHGMDSLSFEVCEIVGSALDLVNREQVWIERYKSTDPTRGYNICKNAGSVLGFRHSESSKTRMSAARKGMPAPKLTDESRALIAAARRGSKHSEEAKRKMSAAAKARVGRVVSVETREKISLSNKGKKRSEETRRRISEARRRVTLTSGCF